MENLQLLKNYIDSFKGEGENQVLESLRNKEDLRPFEKNLIYVYLFPKPIMHMELPGIIINNRKACSGNECGYLEANDRETLILLRAYNTLQYKKFMIHLLHSFVEDEELIFIENDQNDYKCACCGKPIYGYNKWKSICDNNPAFGEQNRREYLAYGSSQSNLCMCLDCMVQLQNLNRILEGIEGKNYLRLWGK